MKKKLRIRPCARLLGCVLATVLTAECSGPIQDTTKEESPQRLGQALPGTCTVLLQEGSLSPEGCYDVRVPASEENRWTVIRPCGSPGVVCFCRKETFAETLENSHSYGLFFSFQSEELDPEASWPPENSCLSAIARSPLYAKLLEDIRGPFAASYIQDLCAQLEKDVAGFVSTRRMWEQRLGNKLPGSEWQTHDSDLQTQLQQVMPLASRLYVEQMLVGQFYVSEALPLVFDAVDAMEGSPLMSWDAAMFACDRILSAEAVPPESAAQGQVREEYLAWKKSLAEEEPKRAHSLDYQSEGSPLGPADDITLGTDSNPEGPQQDVVAFARRFLDAGAQ